MKQILNWLCVLVAALVLVACGSKLNPDSFAEVKTGMSLEEVKALLGKPDEVESGELLGLTSTTYTYDNDGGYAQIWFINGNVSRKHYQSNKDD
jgi:hypothetical protein